jgi:hypothetical protein
MAGLFKVAHTMFNVFFARSLTNGRAMIGIFSLAGFSVARSLYGTDMMVISPVVVDSGSEVESLEWRCILRNRRERL